MRKMKRVEDSRTENTYLIMNKHINSYGRLFGGVLMQWIDEVAGMVAHRHDSINSIKPSNIWALLAKCRYRAASDMERRRARAAVVIFSPRGSSSICASACNICSFLSPDLVVPIIDDKMKN